MGTSGWNYPHWRVRFYPEGLPQRHWLTYAAARMDALEVNATFYGSMRPKTFAAWRAEVEARPDFRFAVKGSRYITHMKKLRDVEQALANFFATGPLLLGSALGPILWQLPPQLPFDEVLVDEFLAMLPRHAAAAQRLAGRHDERFGAPGRASVERGPGLPARGLLQYAVEPRHPTFLGDRFLALCAKHGVAACVADLAGKQVDIDTVTAPIAYLRLHGSRKKYASKYTDAELDAWAERCRRYAKQGAAEVYVFFDNDGSAHAAHDAMNLRTRLHGFSDNLASWPGSPSM